MRQGYVSTAPRLRPSGQTPLRRALQTIFKNYDKIETTVETTEKGVVVVHRSTDATTVAAFQQHAAEVTDFVEEGMVAMHTAMMRNGSGVMHGEPNGEAAPDAR